MHRVVVCLFARLSVKTCADNWSSSSRYLEGLLAGVYLVSIFALQQELEEAIPGMRLSGAMTFFFGPVYFQYHLQRFQAPN
jgi:hypothetical protein